MGSRTPSCSLSPAARQRAPRRERPSRRSRSTRGPSARGGAGRSRLGGRNRGAPPRGRQRRLEGIDRFGQTLSVTYADASYFRDAVPVLARSLTPAQADALRAFSEQLPAGGAP
ncbi:MAG: hypothetical protein M5U28_26755 [Sandaracinaceae bacterium]|nr:hypothetical protein [Sandaracinaceae bacterium]